MEAIFMGHLPARQETMQHSAGTTRTCPKCGQLVAETQDLCPHHTAPVLSAEAMARVGTRVGDYEIKGVIGEGGTGVVYRGRHAASDKPVAIKILHDRGAQKKDVVEQFISEARATSRIRHTNVVDVTDLGTTPDGTVFVAMEYLQGESLWSRLRQVQRLPLFEAINILRQVARGLGTAHEAGIVHGGLKPADIFLCKRKGRRRIVRRSKAQGMRLVVEPEENFDLVKLLDFGMARFLDLAPGAQASAGAVSGTLHYLSPEQAQGQLADRQSDIYSLGAVFYEMVTGAVPFGGESLLDILRGHVSGQVIAPSRRTPGAGVDGRIDALILRCLKKNPLLRFASTGQLCEALDACTTDRAFLRDAHRLPGIVGSGIDLSEASPEARQDGARSAEEPTAAKVAAKPAVAQVTKSPAVEPVAKKPPVAPVPHKPAVAPVAEKSTAASVVAKAAVAPVAKKPAAASVAAKPAVAPVAENPTVASVVQKLAAAPAAETAAAAQARAKSTANLFAETQATAPVVAKPAVAPVAERPATAPAAQAPAKTPMVDDPAAAVITPPPELVAMADDPAAGVVTPPPELVAMAENPTAAVITPPPEVVASEDLTAEIPAELAEQLRRRMLDEERPEHFGPEADVLLDKTGLPNSRRPWVMALVGALLLGGVGIAVWAARSGSAPHTMKPVVVSAPVPTPAPASAPGAAAPVVAPAAPATAAPAAALPKPEPAAPVETARATARGSGKVASSRIRPVSASSARRTARVIRVPPETATALATEAETAPVPAAETATAPAAETATAPAAETATAPAPVAKAETAPVAKAETAPAPAAKAKPQPESELPAPRMATAESKPTPTVDDLVREAQHAWMAGHYAAAIGKAQSALKAEPTLAQAVQAYEIIATCSCAIGKADAARAAASHLSDTKREAVKAVCEKNGVTIE